MSDSPGTTTLRPPPPFVEKLETVREVTTQQNLYLKQTCDLLKNSVKEQRRTHWHGITTEEEVDFDRRVLQEIRQLNQRLNALERAPPKRNLKQQVPQNKIQVQNSADKRTNEIKSVANIQETLTDQAADKSSPLPTQENQVVKPKTNEQIRRGEVREQAQRSPAKPAELVPKNDEGKPRNIVVPAQQNIPTSNTKEEYFADDMYEEAAIEEGEFDDVGDESPGLGDNRQMPTTATVVKGTSPVKIVETGAVRSENPNDKNQTQNNQSILPKQPTDKTPGKPQRDLVPVCHLPFSFVKSVSEAILAGGVTFPKTRDLKTVARRQTAMKETCRAIENLVINSIRSDIKIEIVTIVPFDDRSENLDNVASVFSRCKVPIFQVKLYDGQKVIVSQESLTDSIYLQLSRCYVVSDPVTDFYIEMSLFDKSDGALLAQSNRFSFKIFQYDTVTKLNILNKHGNVTGSLKVVYRLAEV